MQRREQLRVKAIDDQMECDRRAAIEAEASKSGSKVNVARRQKAALQEQMKDREKLAEEALLEAERDRQMVEAVVQKILNEDAAANFARRSPYPMINLLRTPQVRAAQKGIPTGSVYDINEKNLHSVGVQELQDMLDARDWEGLKGRSYAKHNSETWNL